VRLTPHNLEKHRSLFAEIGPNVAVIVRERWNPDVPGQRDVRAERYRLLENHRAQEGWTLTAPYCAEPTATVDDLLARCPELARYHFIPTELVDIW
jgi:hypothetical protein